ncbi:hypothetical protein HKX48_000178 [Thoreauomyces humboldtii]|nr:hypothetical protein HKX48_000178 [Thoreauomyces humboldtii]
MGKHKHGDSDRKDRKEKKHKRTKDKKERKDRHEKSSSSSRKEKHSRSRSPSESDSDNQWVEKPAHGAVTSDEAPSQAPPPPPPETKPPAQARDDWMSAPHEGFDFTGTRGAAVPRKREREVQREEEAARKAGVKAERELNPYFKDGGAGLPPVATGAAEIGGSVKPRKYEYGDGGSNWRMMKLKRAYEAAEEEDRDIEEIAEERYGSMSDFEDAKAERAHLDNRASGGTNERNNDDRRRDNGKDEFGRDVAYRPTVRHSASFQKPAERGGAPIKRRNDDDSEPAAKRPRQDNRELSKPVPKIPTLPTPSTMAIATPQGGPVLSKNALNALQSKVLKARLMGLPNLAELEEQYERQKRLAECAPPVLAQPAQTVLSGVDSRGRLLDVGSEASPNEGAQRIRKKVEKDTHDEKGNRLRYTAQDDKSGGIADMILQEKAAGIHDFDAHMADSISRDSTYAATHDYVDDNIDRLSKRKTTSEDQKRKIAIGDYQKHEKAIAKCAFCFHDDTVNETTTKPRVPIISLATRTYLCLPQQTSLVPGHCLIVPTQHVLTTLDCDDETWAEIRNFKKSLIRMFAALDQGVIFWEQVVDLKWHKHTVIVCVPLPIGVWEDAPAYFKEAVLASEQEEWSQHRKLIDTSKPGGFRSALVPNLPYFHVWFTPDTGLGHVIEDSGEWKEWFAREVVGSALLELPVDLWRKPRFAAPSETKTRMAWFLQRWKDSDWTKMLDET